MKIAILSRGPQLYSTQSLYRAGARQGHQMRVVDHTRCQLVMNAHNPGVLYEGEPLERLDAVIPRIGSSVTAHGAALISHFELMEVFTAIRAGSLLQSRDKMKCLQRLTAAGLDIPHTAYPGNGNHIAELVNYIGGLPVVIKLLESTHGAGVILSESMKSVEATVEAFARLNEKVLIQEFVREAEGADLRAFVVGGRIVAAMRRQARAGEFRSNLHRGATAVKVRLSREEADLALRAVRVLGLDVAGVDILQSRRGPLVLEVNASPGLEGIETITGVDVADRIIQYVEYRVQKRQEARYQKR